MMKIFDEDVLYKRLVIMPFWKQKIFLLLVCQRMVLNFEIFSKENNFNDFKLLTSILEYLWDNVSIWKKNKKLSSQINVLSDLSPDTEDFDSIYVSSALDAVCATIILLESFEHESTSSILEAVTLIRDSVDMYIQDIQDISPKDVDIERKIQEHPLMQQELDAQDVDFEFIQNLDDDIDVSFSIARKKWYKKYKNSLFLNG